MTNTETLQAGREMDAMIATTVMGYTLNYEFEEVVGAPCVPALRDQYDEWGYLPEYSTDIAAAFQVVEHLRAQWPQQTGRPARYWQIVTHRDGTWSVCIREENAGITATRLLARHIDMSLPLAICRAALEVTQP